MVNKQQIRPALVSAALEKLTKINPFYSNITIDNDWEDFSEQSDPLIRMPGGLIAVIRLVVMI